jgi:chromosome segregation ATPase
MAAFPSGLEALLDQRLKQHSDQINNLFAKFIDTTKADLQSIKQSQDFLAVKFDDLVASTNKLKDENDELRKMNIKLQERVGVLEAQYSSANDEIESTKCYLRRDLLEFHGIPESSTENTNSLIMQVVNLIAPELNICESDIST